MGQPSTISGLRSKLFHNMNWGFLDAISCIALGWKPGARWHDDIYHVIRPLLVSAQTPLPCVCAQFCSETFLFGAVQQPGWMGGPIIDIFTRGMIGGITPSQQRQWKIATLGQRWAMDPPGPRLVTLLDAIIDQMKCEFQNTGNIPPEYIFYLWHTFLITSFKSAEFNLPSGLPWGGNVCPGAITDPMSWRAPHVT